MIPCPEEGALSLAHEQVLIDMSREMSLICDPQGVIRWADERAARQIGARRGATLEDLAAPGTGTKVRQLLASGTQEAVRGWELAMVVRRTVATVAFEARPIPGGIALVGSLFPESYGAAFSRMAETMSELAELHRRSADQERELRQRNEDLVRLHRELAESSRGVVALHAELEEKADTIHRVSEVKTRVIANVSHEFRTPLNAILGITTLFLDRADGELTAEQVKQIGYIRASAEALSTLANDLLDLSMAETGKLTLRAAGADVRRIFAALRGMLRPLAGSGEVALIIEDPAEPMRLDTDEGKLAQILRNLVSNALKFTERGEVRVRAEPGPPGEITFSVSDTGIGISPEDQPRIFEEFTQIEGPLQARTKGAGLGLALARRLAELLGGALTLESAPGVGSTFSLTIPRVHPDVVAMRAMVERGDSLDPNRAPILILDDDRRTLLQYQNDLAGSGFQIIPARTVADARCALRRARPAAIVLDVMLEKESTWAFLVEIKANPDTRDIPVMVVTVTDRAEKARALGADAFVAKPTNRASLLEKLRKIAAPSPAFALEGGE